MPQKVKFIVLFQGRAGSSYLMDALNRHPEITARGEILAKEYHKLHPRTKPTRIQRFCAMVGRPSTAKCAAWQLKRTERFYTAGAPERRVVGFKTKLRHLIEPRQMKEFLEYQGIKTIIMTRQNLIKKTVAHLYGQRLFQKTRHKYGERAWNLFDEGDKLGPQYLAVEEFNEMLERVISLNRKLHLYAQDLSIAKLNLEYADLIRNKNAWFQSVFDFLGVERCHLESAILQNEPDDLRQALENFDELRSYYAGTEYEQMFDEVISKEH